MLLQGRAGEAEQALAEIAADRWAAEPYNALRACYTCSQAQRARAGWAPPSPPAGKASSKLRPPDRRHCRLGVAHLGLAEILRERNELEGALDHATEGAALCRQLGYAQWQVTSLAALAWIRGVRQPARRPGGHRGGRAGPAQPGAGHRPDLPGRRAAGAAVARSGPARRRPDWVAARGLTGESKPDYAHERESLVLVRLRIAQQTPRPGAPVAGAAALSRVGPRPGGQPHRGASPAGPGFGGRG